MRRPIDDFKVQLDRATSSRDADGVPNVAVIAADRNGTILQKLESGTWLPHSANPNPHPTDSRQIFTADTVSWIASCTKLMTTISVLQCVERGILALDAPIAESWLPELQTIDILASVQDGKPITKKSTVPITLRHLLTHSSGIAYEFSSPKLAAWRAISSSTPDGKTRARSKNIAEAHWVPLLFEPGAAWIYGYGIDWAGLAVMRATAQSLEEYMTQNIWRPLGMTSTTFSVSRHRPDLWDRLAGMTERKEDGALIDTDGGAFWKSIERVEYGGGGGCFSTANDYIRLLSSVLATSTDSPAEIPTLLTQSSVQAMFTPSLTDASTAALRSTIAHPAAFGLAGDLLPQVATSYGLGGIMNLEAIEKTGRSAGAMQWSGLPNLFWWISPEDGVCGCYFGQLLPPGDVVSFGLYGEFERAVLVEVREGVRGNL